MAASLATALIGSAASAAIGGIFGNKAADAQGDAADRSLALQREIYNQTREDLAPFMGAGSNALAAYEYDMGLRGTRPRLSDDVKSALPVAQRAVTAGGKEFADRSAARQYLRGQMEAGKLPGFEIMRTNDGSFRIKGGGAARYETRADAREGRNALVAAQIGTGAERFRVGNKLFNTAEEAQAASDRRYERRGGEFYEGYEKSPGYENILGEALGGVQSSAAARGSLYSGATLKRLTETAGNVAAQDYGNHLARLGFLSNQGANAAAGAGGAGASFARGGANSILAAGDAQANGFLNIANAGQSFLSNAAGAFGAFGGGSGSFAPSGFAVPRNSLGFI